jgi:hypothetical protein
MHGMPIVVTTVLCAPLHSAMQRVRARAHHCYQHSSLRVAHIKRRSSATYPQADICMSNSFAHCNAAGKGKVLEAETVDPAFLQSLRKSSVQK